MAKPKYWRMKVKGSLSLDEAQAAVADREGTLLRVHTEGGETDVYFAGAAVKAAGKKGPEKLQAVSVKEITLADVTKIG